MAETTEDRLKALGIALPAPAPAAANYVPFVKAGPFVHISGQVPFTADGLAYQGKLGDDYGVEEGQACARICAINIIAQIKAACDGDLERVQQIVKLGGFVNCTPDFADHPKVINGASDLMVDVFAEKGRHARFAVGAPSLPFDVAVEIDAVVQIA
jgi:enamine deaminase RidA (YjgF/YER057c/UK114 family)